MLNITEPRLIFCDEEILQRMKEVKQELGLSSQIITFENGFDPFIEPHDADQEENFKAEKVDPETDMVFILCTSGTTGFVKGVMFTHSEYYITLVTTEK